MISFEIAVSFEDEGDDEYRLADVLLQPGSRLVVSPGSTICDCRSVHSRSYLGINSPAARAPSRQGVLCVQIVASSCTGGLSGAYTDARVN